MVKLVFNKQTEDQKYLNDIVRFQFIMAVMNRDTKNMNILLHHNKRFSGFHNHWKFLHWLDSQFMRINTPFFHSNYKKGVSLDFNPGAEMLEFIFMTLSDEDMGEDDFIESETSVPEILLKN
ncbi:MAG: hypothetical protein IPG89_08130 [Bacteroidetes bacterium]|nr:hypothetical protein [Bacteroidota bacterium]